MGSVPARHDPVVHRFKPDPELVARAQRYMMLLEDEGGPSWRFIRQRWEEALGAARVALDALREIYPSERAALDSKTDSYLSEALEAATGLFAALDDCAEEIVGEVMYAVLTGRIRTHEKLGGMGVPP